MSSLRRACALTLILGLGVSQTACLATAVGATAGAVIGVTGAAVGGAAKGAGMVVGAVLPGGGRDRDRR
jgi:hypothetical protein